MIHIPADGGPPRVTPAGIAKTDTKRLRRIARGQRGTARGHAERETSAPQPGNERPEANR